MNFKFPPTFSDLLENKIYNSDSYQVTGKNPIQGLDERIKKLQLRELWDAFNIDNQIMQENQRFDLLYYLIRDLKEKYEPQIHSQVLDVLQHQLQQITKQFQDNEKDYEQIFQMTLFLMLSVLPLNQKKAPTQLQQQPQLLGKQGSSSNQILKKALKVVVFILSDHFIVQKLQKDSIHYFFNLIHLFGDIRENEIRELIIQIIMTAINIWGNDSQHLKTLIINLVYENELVITPISQLLQKCYQKEEGPHKQFMNDMVQLLISYVTQAKNNSSVENQATKNLKEILTQTSKIVPKYFYTNLSNLINLYDNENYYMRNALTEILTNVVEYLVLDQELIDNQNALLARDKLINTLLYRQHDKVAWSRSAVLNSFSSLLKKNCVPKEFLNPIFEMAVNRIKDISGWVRKAALNTIKQIIKYYRQLYVVSQDKDKFFTLDALEVQFQENTTELTNILEVFQQVKKEFDCKAEETHESHNFQDNMLYIKKETDRNMKSKNYLNEYKTFLTKIMAIIQPITVLMTSRNQGDVIQSIKLIAYMTRYELEGFEKGLKKMFLLVWNQDKITKQEVFKQFWKLFLDNKRYSLDQISQSLMCLYSKSDISIEASLNQILLNFLSEDSEHKLHSKIFDSIWDLVIKNYKSKDVNIDALKSQLKIAKVFFQQQSNLLTEDNLLILLELLSLQKKENYQSSNQIQPQWMIIKEICLIFQHSSEKNVVRCIKIALLILFQNFGCQDTKWFQVCEVVLELITKVSKPEKFYEFFIKKMASKLVLDKTETQDIKIELSRSLAGSPDLSQDDMEIEQLEDSSSNDAHFKYSQLLFSIGHISIKILTHTDQMVNHLKIIKSNQEGKNKDSSNKKENEQQNELDKIVGGHEADYYKSIDLLQEITEKKILQQNMIAAFIPFVLSITKAILKTKIQRPNKQQGDQIPYQNSLLEKICILTLCKFMCVSEEFCTNHLQILFELLKYFDLIRTRCENVDYAIKNNIIISLGDLLHRFPNTVQNYHKQIYSNLYDKNCSVRKTTLLVLTHLILNDMIKSKVSLSHIPKLLNDQDLRIPSMVKYFLSELQKKDPRGILNSIPDLVGNLGKSFEVIIPQIVPYLDKNFSDHLVERLLQIMAETEEILEVRAISLCISLLQLPIVSFKKILDKWESIRQKFEDSYVSEQFKNLLKKQKRSQNINPELKDLVEELEMKLDNFRVETFESKRRVPEKSKRNSKLTQNKSINEELPQQQQNEQQQPQKKQQNIQKIKQKITKKRKDSFVENSQTEEEERDSSFMDLETPKKNSGVVQRQKINRRTAIQQHIIESSDEN